MDPGLRRSDERGFLRNYVANTPSLRGRGAWNTFDRFGTQISLILRNNRAILRNSASLIG